MRLILSGIQSIEDVKTAVNLGADAVGMLVGQQGPGENFILPSTAARLAEGMPPVISTVLITQFKTVEDIVDIACRTGINTIQFSGISPENTALLRERLPRTVKLIPEICNDDFLPGFVMAHVGEYIGVVNAFALKITAPERINELPDIIAALPLPVIVSGCSDDVAAAAGAFACCRLITAGA
jgi:phosphoribosylanthranilate isomerase